MSHVRVCSCCGCRVEVEGKRKQTLYTHEGKLLTEPFICEDCLDLIDDFTEPEDENPDIEQFYPSEVDVGVLV